MLNTLKFQRNPAISKAPEVAFRGQFLELMGGVEQICNSETVEISRKERRPSRGVSKSVSSGHYPTFLQILCNLLIL